MKVDSIVEALREELLRRSQVGIKKYNTTLDRTDLELSDWLQHAAEEGMDMTLYLKRAKKDVEELNEQFDELVRDYFELKQQFELKDRIIETLNKVIFSQEQEIRELQKEKHLQEKRRAWHY